MSWVLTLLACGALPLGLGADVETPAPASAVERWPDGTPRVEGAREGEVPVGTWTWWEADGSFRSRTTFVDGLQHGSRREVGLDGRLVELRLERGVLVGFRTLPADTPMPEWEGGRRIEGTRYRALKRAP